MTTFSFNTFLASLTTLLLIMGCDQESSMGPENQKQNTKLVHWFAAGIPEAIEQPSNRSLAERKQALEDFKADSKSFKALRNERSWREADRRARALLAMSSSVPQHTRQQLAADCMLKHWLLDGKQTPDKQEALSFYTELMIRNRSPQAQILRLALERLEGAWPDDRIARSARIAADAARHHLEDNGVRVDENISRAMKRGMSPEEAQTFDNSSSLLKAQLLTAISELETMSENKDA